MLQNLKVTNKLAILSGFMIIALIATGVTGIISMRSLTNEADEITDVWLGGAYSLGNIQANLLNIGRIEEKYVHSSDPQERREWVEEINDLKSQIQEQSDYYETTIILDTDRAYFTNMDAAIDQYYAINEQILEAGRNSSDESVQSLSELKRAGDTAFEDASRIISEMIEFNREQAEVARNSVKSTSSTANSLMLGVLVVGTLLSLGFSWLIVSSITKPINGLLNMTQQVAQGNLNLPDAQTSKDEIGGLANTFNQMTAAIRRMFATEVENRQTLENTVAGYVAFVEVVAKGELKDRIAIDRNANQDEPLTRLGLNLNKMVDGLEELTERIEEAATNEREARYRLQETVDEYVGFVEQVAQGNLTKRIELNGNGNGRSKQHEDQLFKLGDNLNRMVASLYEITGQTRDVSLKIASATSEILAATTQQLSAATEQDTTINQTSTTTTEVLATVTQTAERAENVARVAQRSVEVSQQGQQVVKDSVEGMGMIRHQVEGIAENILALSEKTQQIGQIIASVNDIAEQSKVLALNASIEAARAGEEGKSFAVVAMEVRNLAEQSREATDQVREILNEIQQATNTAVMATEEGIKGVDVGQGLINRAGDTIQELASVIREAAQAAAQIAASTHQQTVGMDQLSAAMHAIRQSSVQTTASVQQAERSAQDLSSMARQMQDAVSRYSL